MGMDIRVGKNEIAAMCILLLWMNHSLNFQLLCLTPKVWEVSKAVVNTIKKGRGWALSMWLAFIWDHLLLTVFFSSEMLNDSPSLTRQFNQEVHPPKQCVWRDNGVFLHNGKVGVSHGTKCILPIFYIFEMKLLLYANKHPKGRK